MQNVALDIDVVQSSDVLYIQRKINQTRQTVREIMHVNNQPGVQSYCCWLCFVSIHESCFLCVQCYATYCTPCTVRVKSICWACSLEQNCVNVILTRHVLKELGAIVFQYMHKEHLTLVL